MLRSIRSRHAAAAVAAVTAVASALACGAERPPEPPRLVVLYSVCTVNKHYLQPYRHDVEFTPSLARFGAEGAVFSSHRTESGSSGTAFASIFSGVQADRHGVFKHPRKLDPDLYLIFEAFRDAGYETYYFADHQMAAPGLRYSQGVARKHIIKRPLTGTDPRFLQLLQELRADPKRRAFVATAFSVTHAPWNLDDMPTFREQYPQSAFRASPVDVEHYLSLFHRHRFALQTKTAETIAELGLSPEEVETLGTVLDVVYESKISLLDRYFGSTVDAVDEAGLADESIIAFTADHGQQMAPGQRFRWTHGPDLAPDVIDVPLVVRAPGVPPQEVSAVTRSIDVYPTLAGLAGIPPPSLHGAQGTDLSAALRGDAAFPDQIAYSHGTLRHWSYVQPDLIEFIWASARQGDALYTWRRSGGAWTFDARDAATGEPLDVAQSEERAASRALWSYRTRMIDAFRERNPTEAGSKQEELDGLAPNEAGALRALGYIE